MERKRQRELALGAVAVVLAAIAIWTTQSNARQSASGATSVVPGAANVPAGKSPVADVDLEALRKDRPQPDDTTRNPFRFEPKAPPSPPPSAAVMAQQPPDLAPGPVEPPLPPRIPLKYIGEVRVDASKPDRKMAVLSDARGVYYGREGDIIEGRYRIVKIGVESIELEYLDGRGRQTIRQTGQ